MIYIGSDHAGFDLKASLKQWLSDQGRAYSDLGTKQADVCDYPDFAFPVAKRVVASPGDLGVLICGSGVGMAIAAGKVRGARPALAWMPDIAKQARAHDDANILVLPARFMDANLAIDCLEQFLQTELITSEERYARRLQKIVDFEEKFLQTPPA